MADSSLTLDSIRFFYKHEGDPSLPLVVLSHALMADHRMWDATVPALHAAGFSTLRYDHVGHGRTTFSTPDAAARRYHFDDFTRHIRQLVEHVVPGRKAFEIIGCSMGGVLALRYAQMFPGELRKVMSLDAPGLKSLEEAKPLWRERIARWEAEGSVEGLAKATVERWFPDPCPKGVREGMLEQVRGCSLEGYKACAGGIMNYDYEEGLRGIEKEEVLVLAGENDSAIGPREVLENVAGSIKGARYVLMKGVGHIPPFHDPEGFNGIMLKFFRG